MGVAAGISAVAMSHPLSSKGSSKMGNVIGSSDSVRAEASSRDRCHILISIQHTTGSRRPSLRRCRAPKAQSPELTWHPTHPKLSVVHTDAPPPIAEMRIGLEKYLLRETSCIVKDSHTHTQHLNKKVTMSMIQKQMSGPATMGRQTHTHTENDSF